ncbi:MULTISPECIES: DUF6282 family protein [unclassified Facklamia]|uniref:DUF6282 family protein n=1 Tax=Aerococcaceae TaxID=186827 RepID=UPI0013BE6B2C|nr:MULTISPECIES: DUF6282 family protein [unclassified Facklamia]NEW64903.1 cytosolic protein [Facklamia sp. 252]NEW68225.1 cytosolic protein [Facklamia sp. 253]QQD66068.1 hypothetical protein JDW14_02795 [Aerococcaceae bacterium zg-252]
MENILKGAYDLHVHSGPDIMPRKFDDLELAERIKNSGMNGYVMKSHYFNTAQRGYLVKKIVPDCDAIGAIALNQSVGGINSLAVEMAARSGAKLVWFPTTDSENEMSYVDFEDKNKKLAFWAKIVKELKDQQVNVPTINILKNNELIPEAVEVLKTIAKYNMILATGHLSHDETFALVKKANELGVKNIIITHVDFPTTFYSVEEQLELASYGAYMEHCYVTWKSGKVDFSETVRQIRALTPEKVILSTDSGQGSNPFPDECLKEFSEKLMENGFTYDEIRTMIVDNPKKLLGVE